MTRKEVRDRIKKILSAGRNRSRLERDLYLEFIEYIMDTNDDSHAVDLAGMLLKIGFMKSKPKSK